MKRWNDKLRPVELVEIDKQGHKMIVAWLLYELNTQDMPLQRRLELGEKIIEGALFDYFYRLVITDIKPPVFYRIRENSEHYEKLTNWVLEELEPVIAPLSSEFWKRLQAYFLQHRGRSLADDILGAAHAYASGWEFDVIKPFNTFDTEHSEIEDAFKERIGQYTSVRGVAELSRGTQTPLGAFAQFCGQLRFQKRWSQLPLIPETSVLGHMFTVACYAYFFSLELNACRARKINNFYCGLFHDLPELLTRDIISPVKRSVDGLSELLREYEQEKLEQRVFSPLQEAGANTLVERLQYFLGTGCPSEFCECIRINGQIKRVSFAELQESANVEDYDPRDGRLIKICDGLAAFVEAHASIRNGIASKPLYEAAARMRDVYRHEKLGSLHVGSIFADFD